MAATSETSPFQSGYYQRRYKDRFWRERGDRPLFFRGVLRALRPWWDGALLDVGCGEGHFLRRAADNFTCFGVDVSEEGVLSARENSGLTTITVGSALDIPFEPARFDVVTCLDVVEHLPQPTRFFSQAHRVLRSGGALFITTPNPASLGHMLKGPESHLHKDSTHISIHPIDTWRAMIRANGFQVVTDGTDGFWDTPYFRSFPPTRVQWLLFQALTQAAWLVRPFGPSNRGENYCALAVACA